MQCFGSTMVYLVGVTCTSNTVAKISLLVLILKLVIGDLLPYLKSCGRRRPL